MFRHYIKIALRNLWKYKTQTVLSVLGLGVGLLFFSLSMFWMQYIDSFDSFHPHANRIYVVQRIDTTSLSKVSRITAYPLGNYLEEHFPEIEAATTTHVEGFLIDTPSGPEWFLGLGIEESFFTVFGYPQQPINPPYHRDEDNNSSRPKENMPVTITREAAQKIFGDRPCLGESIQLMQGPSLLVENEMQGWGANTNIPFSFLFPSTVQNVWNMQMYYTYVLVKEGINVKELNKKLAELHFDGDSSSGVTISPLKTFKKDYPEPTLVVKYEYIRLFALAGLLIALCGLFNYLMLFINRIRMRSREFALRQVNGASVHSLLTLVYTEFAIILLVAFVLGGLGIYGLLPEFKELSKINLSNQVIYVDSLQYVLFLIVGIVLLSVIPIYFYQRKTLHASIRKDIRRSNLFYTFSVLLQLMVSMAVVFCSYVLMSQISHLTNLDIGFDRHRVARVDFDDTQTYETSLFPYADIIQDLPAVEESLKYQSIMIWSWARSFQTFKWIGNAEGPRISYEIYDVTPEFIPFFNLQLLEGTNFNPDIYDKSEVIINETAANMLKDKSFSLGGENKKIIGVVKDFQPESPEIKVPPIMLTQTDDVNSFVYRYKDGMKKEAEKQITQLIQQDEPDIALEFRYMEDAYDSYYRSEHALLKILLVTTIVCLLISIFGVYSLVALTCARQRKDIAIRKVNGASVWSIFLRLVRGYMGLLLVACVIVFPITHKVMAVWIEHYVNRIAIGWEIYVLIFLGAALLITITVFSQVWRAASQNPAEVLKAE